MFEFLVFAILIGVLFGLQNLLKKTGALEHETPAGTAQLVFRHLVPQTQS